MQLTTPIFIHQSIIPEKYASKGKNRNPQLDIQQAPKHAMSFVIIMHDPDAWGDRDFLHWIMWNIPANITTIGENTVPEGAVVGVNDKGVTGYLRPMPLARSGIHHYTFELYALNALLDLPAHADRKLIESTINAHTIEKAQLIGLYGR